jgi:dsRNA-specific ribonuclease
MDENKKDVVKDVVKMERIIRKTLELGKIKKHYVDILVSHELEYQEAFTSQTYDKRVNYEIYEALGDPIAGAFLLWYFYRTFPQLDCPGGVRTLTRLKNNYASKRTFSEIADKLGFWPYIRASPEEKAAERESLLEDVFEAFLGVTTKILDNELGIGVGYAVCYDILAAIFNEIPISLEYEDLYDAKSRLKELFDVSPFLGTLKYEDAPTVTTIYRITNGQKIQMAQGTGKTKSDRQQGAAKIAIDELEKQGYTRKDPYKLVCE